MLRTHWLSQIIYSVAVLTLVNGSGISAYAQGYSGRDAEADLDVPLLSGAKCTSAVQPSRGTSKSGLQKRKYNVSVGSQFYESPFYLASDANKGSATLVCRVDPNKYRILSLKMGIVDDAPPSTRMTVHIYQGGNVIYTHNAKPGKLLVSVLNLSDSKALGHAHNIGIKVICQRDKGDLCYLMFLQAKLIHASSDSSNIKVGHRSTKPVETSSTNRSRRRNNSSNKNRPLRKLSDSVNEFRQSIDNLFKIFR